MKTVIFSLIVAFAVHGQGTVNFNNNGNFAMPADRLVRDDRGFPLVGTNYVAQLYYGGDLATLVPLTNALARFRVVTTSAPGTWAGGTRTLTGFTSGMTAVMIVRAWDSVGGTVGFEEARAQGLPWGESAPFTYTVPEAGSGSTNYNMENFRGFQIGRCHGVIRMAQPESGSIFRTPASITLRADNVSVPGTVTNITYLSGSDVLGSVTTPPFSFTAPDLPVGDYFFQAIVHTDAGEFCRSDVSSVRVMEPPNPVVNPQTYTALHGSDVTFNASAGGSEPASYRWYFNSELINDTFDPLLQLANVTDAMSGFYRVIASNAVGVSTSAPAVLKVRRIIVVIDEQVVHTPVYTSALPVTVRFVTSYPRGAVFYTLDGSAPDFTAMQFTGPFLVDRRSSLRAIAYSAHFFESGEAEPVEIVLPPLRRLTAMSAGGGSISLSPSSGVYAHGETVQLTAQPAEGWSFLEWRGDVFGTNPVASIKMTDDRCVRAVFGTTLTTTVAGNGRIALDPPGGVYPYGTIVRLYAVPESNNYFVLWGNYASGSQNPLSFPVTLAQPQISSAFHMLNSNQVTLTALPDGEGSIQIQPRTNRYSRGQIVQIRALPADQQEFLRWSGDLTTSQNTNVLTLNSSMIVRAHFTKKPRLDFGPCDGGLGPQGFLGTIVGTWGTPYRVSFSSDLENWQMLTIVTNRFGTTQFNDLNDLEATNFPARIYRAELLE